MEEMTFVLRPVPPCPIKGLKPGKPERVTVSATGIVTMGRALGAWRLVRVQYAGPRVVQQTVTEQTGQTKRKGRVIGAAVGAVATLGSPLGAAIGAGVGTGNKRHTSTSVSTVRDVEEPSTLAVWLLDLETGMQACVGFAGMYAELGPFAGWCSEVLGNRLGPGRAPVAQPVRLPQAAPSAPDPYDEVMKLKRLLDAGAVTAEEFEAKKRELLGL